MKYLLLVLSCLLMSANVCLADTYNYISPEQMRNQMSGGIDMVIVDIQVEKEFKQHHLPGSIATYAYPVKSDSERASLTVAVNKYNETGNQVVIICPRGEGGAKRTYDYMRSQNIPEDKLVILEKGIAGWPYKELVEGE